MATQTRMRQSGFFHGPAWPRDNTSNFELDSPPDNPVLSSGYESLISEDLNLYEASLEAALTNEQISMLNGRVNKFKAADYKVREEITKDFLGSFKSACPQGVKFDDVTIGTHIRMLERCLPKFQGANPKSREKMVKEAADHIKSAWTGGAEFDRDTVISVSHCLVEQKLTDDQCQVYKAMAKEWSEKKLPPGDAAMHGPRAMREFTSSVYHQFGMFDYNEQNGGIFFKSRHKNWRQYEMVDDFSKWGTDSFGENWKT
ncbi:hypothetical protein F5888DRAFT_1638454 [Russula emetica]|nr:hypothetical protein F5888DRAFT_1638454 [Russula emetica]